MTGHGTRACYGRGCRRPECVAANRDYQRAYMRGRARTIPAAGTRDTICALILSGETRASIAATTGYSPSLVGRLAAGRVQRVHPETADDFTTALHRRTP